jgi:hypothetical protein
MIIKRSIHKDGNILPEAYNYLVNLPDKSSHHLEYGEFHPLDIYNSSIGRIIKAFSTLINELKNVREAREIKVKNLDSILESQKELLHSLHSHVDDCNKILKITSPFENIDQLNSNRKKQVTRSLHSWHLYFKNPYYKYFEEKTRKFRTFGKIVNKIKHHQARLRLISIENLEYSLGYYVEGKITKDENVIVCPDLQIHPDFTAFSFSRDMALNFYILYFISYYLSKSLIKLNKKEYELSIPYSPCEATYTSDLKEIGKYIQDYNLNYFPDEYLKQVPLVSISGSNDINLILNLDENFLKAPDRSKLTVFFYQEGYSKVSHVIRPYVDFMSKKYNIENFKIISDGEFV